MMKKEPSKYDNWNSNAKEILIHDDYLGIDFPGSKLTA